MRRVEPGTMSFGQLPRIHPAAISRARHGITTNLLVWHDFVPLTREVWFDTTTTQFHAQVAELQRAGAVAVTLETIYNWLFHGANPPPPGAIAICCDDNTVGIYDIAFPILHNLGWPFAVSVHTAYVGITTVKRHNSWQMLQEMELGGATIVSQTHSHPPDLRTLGDMSLAREMAMPRRSFELHLRRPAAILTYPSGKWDDRVAQAAAGAGYQMALTEDHGASEASPHILGVHRYSTHRWFERAVSEVAKSALAART